MFLLYYMLYYTTYKGKNKKDITYNNRQKSAVVRRLTELNVMMKN